MLFNPVFLILGLVSTAYAVPVAGRYSYYADTYVEEIKIVVTETPLRPSADGYYFTGQFAGLLERDENFQIMNTEARVTAKAAKKLVLYLFDIGADARVSARNDFFGSKATIAMGFTFEVEGSQKNGPSSGPLVGWVKGRYEMVGHEVNVQNSTIEGHLKTRTGETVFQVCGGQATQQQ
ncbi:hypothetical protein GGU11DRAFT_786108 [Lentinula aff. detonsa]|uniref:Dirigent protein n=1 Tax=Lentinula aff. detonsa TaxID=2804958 RepID=A0AA38NJZ1_9AGAR|nr:hypothetical protein GGU10DRAFT_390004 [Lentinula aff. detonsa]KAJ3797084.1 hypothetical protein GGU11DRAFT_786108 [Lentinula aff. detonsa]